MILGRYHGSQIPDCDDIGFKNRWSTTDAFIACCPQARLYVPDDVALVPDGTLADVLADVTSREELKVACVRTYEPHEPSVFMATKFNHDGIRMKRR